VRVIHRIELRVSLDFSFVKSYNQMDLFSVVSKGWNKEPDLARGLSDIEFLQDIDSGVKGATRCHQTQLRDFFRWDRRQLRSGMFME